MPSITFKPICIASNRRRDGTYPVRIRVTFKGVSRRLATNLVAVPADLTRSLHIKNPNILNKAQALIRQMQATTADLSPFTTDTWDVDRVVRHIRSTLYAENFRLDFFQYAEKVLASKNPSTRRVYESALNSLEHFLGRRELDINDITKRMLLDWRESVARSNKRQLRRGVWTETKKPQSGGTASRNIRAAMHIYLKAQNEYNGDEKVLIPRNPFTGVPRDTPPSHGQKNLGPEMILRLAASECRGKERIALDAFLLSFCLMGANLADLWDAKPCGIAGGGGAGTASPVWVYNRQKTSGRRQDRAQMRVTIPPEAAPYLERLTAGGGPYWLAALHAIPGDKDGATHKVNRALAGWAARQGVQPFTFYAARKTWASLARRAGVEKATIDECLCHIGDFPVADIYIERDWELLNAANRRAIALLRWNRGVGLEKQQEVDEPEDEAGVLG